MLLLAQPPLPVPPPLSAEAPTDPALARTAELVKAGRWAEACDLAETLDARRRGAVQNDWLKALQRAGRWERLLEVAGAMITQVEGKTGPRLSVYRLYRAQALSQLGRHAEALAAHAQNGELGYLDGTRNACAEARLVPDWAALERLADLLLAKNPADGEALAWKGESLARRDRFAEAEPVLRAALAADPKQALAWSNLGRCLNARKAWAEAGEALDRALALDPREFEALFNRGRARFELKRYAASRDDFRAALALHPGDPVLQENLHQAKRYAATARH
jgi:tetratricopeptide (TPR) repeat protein